jgi:ribosomal 30S subunit maturation factor RimM
VKTIVVGKIRKPQGLKGELELFSFSGDYSWLEEAEALILLPNPQSPVPTPDLKQSLFKIEYYRVAGQLV